MLNNAFCEEIFPNLNLHLHSLSLFPLVFSFATWEKRLTHINNLIL